MFPALGKSDRRIYDLRTEESPVTFDFIRAIRVICGLRFHSEFRDISRIARMLRSITILLLSLAASVAADDKSQREEFRLRATVQDIVTLSTYSGTVTPVDADRRFAVTVRIDSITPSLTNFVKGATVTFAVHSPSQLFGTADAKGKTYDFTLRRETVDGKTRYTSLEVRR